MDLVSGGEKDLIGYWAFKHGNTEDESPHHRHGTPGATTVTMQEPTPIVSIKPAVSVITSNCLPTTVFELQFTRNVVTGPWSPITQEYRKLDDGCRVYSAPVIDRQHHYRLLVLDKE